VARLCLRRARPTITRMNQPVSRNKVVSVTYEIFDGRGELFERSDLPVSYVHGAKESPMFAKIERALEGRDVGDSIEVELPPNEGFGDHRPELTFSDDVDNVPPQFRRLGAEVTFQNEKGEELNMVVTRIEAGRLTLDGNHPLAGQTVRFRVKVAGVRDATPEEIAQGAPGGSPSVH
jgi:FKBP-type peptidyl-prolyl cis-trans isomerase SlyD